MCQFQISARFYQDITYSHFQPSWSLVDPAHVDHERWVLRRMQPLNWDTAIVYTMYDLLDKP